MKKTALLLPLFLGLAHASEDDFQKDRSAILKMAGAFKVDFTFKETIALADDYQLKKPYHTAANELVKVVEDTGKRIALQHLLIVNGETGPQVIKHWAQVWQFEDTRALEFQGDLVWNPINHSVEKTKGTWTQLVTQIDDSPRYMAQGKWQHDGNYSAWTSDTTTRPLPRRDYTKRSDYDLLVVTNRHIITPDGWLHQQDNRKLADRDGKRSFLCFESGLNHYRRVTDEDSLADLFSHAEAHWNSTATFWNEARTTWVDLIHEAENPIRYEKRIDGESLSSTMSDLADEAAAGSTVSRGQINEVLSKFLR